MLTISRVILICIGVGFVNMQNMGNKYGKLLSGPKYSLENVTAGLLSRKQ